MVEHDTDNRLEGIFSMDSAKYRDLRAALFHLIASAEHAAPPDQMDPLWKKRVASCWPPTKNTEIRDPRDRHYHEWIGNDNCHYETWQDIVTSGVLEMCGCIEQGDVVDEIRDYLNWCVDIETRTRREYTSHFYWIACACDSAGLTDHGTSIRGAFLTDFGNEVLAWMDARMAEDSAQ